MRLWIVSATICVSRIRAKHPARAFLPTWVCRHFPNGRSVRQAPLAVATLFLCWLLVTGLPLGCQFGSMSLLNPNVHASVRSTSLPMQAMPPRPDSARQNPGLMLKQAFSEAPRSLEQIAMPVHQLRESSLDSSPITFQSSLVDTAAPALLPPRSLNVRSRLDTPALRRQSECLPEDPPPRA